MKRETLWLLVFPLLLGLVLATSCSKKTDENEPTEAKKTAPAIPKTPEVSRRKIAFVVQRVFLPEFSKTEASKETVSARLDKSDEYAPADDVAAVYAGAKIAGWRVGYEFSPIVTVNKDQTPREAVQTIEDDIDYFLLARVSTRTADIGKASVITVLADTALFRKSDFTPILNAGFLAVHKIAPEKIISSGGDKKVQQLHWMTKVGELFTREFDAKTLSRMQNMLDGSDIANAVARIQEVQTIPTLSVNAEELDGGDDRQPELKLVQSSQDKGNLVFLLREGSAVQRRWYLNETLQLPLEPGKYTIYLDLKTISTNRRFYRAEFTASAKKMYIVDLK